MVIYLSLNFQFPLNAINLRGVIGSVVISSASEKSFAFMCF